MKKAIQRRALMLSVPLLTALSVVACQSTTKLEVSALETNPPFGNDIDVAHAQSLWENELANYRSWSAYPGLDGYQPGRSPHGKVLRYYINDAAGRDLATPRSGSIIVKENFMAESRESLAAVTVMQKIPGYDPENGDWFWVKYGPQGEVLSNPKGMLLSGRVAKGAPQGCIACHYDALGDDFLFVNDN